MQSLLSDVGSNQTSAYRYASRTGLITLIAAGTASAGHLFACRWSHATKVAIVTNFKASWQQATSFAASQDVGFALHVTRAYTAAHTGGTAATLTGDAFKLRSSYPSTSMADIRIATTAELTNGTHTIDTLPMLMTGYSELAASTTRAPFSMSYPTSFGGYHGIILTQNTGLLLLNNNLMGATGTARVYVELEWIEKDRY